MNNLAIKTLKKNVSVVKFAVATGLFLMIPGCETVNNAFQKEFKPPSGSTEEELCGIWTRVVTYENDPAIESTTFVVTLRYGHPRSDTNTAPYISGFCTMDHKLTAIGQEIGDIDRSGATMAGVGMPITKLVISSDEASGVGEYATGRKTNWTFSLNKEKPGALFITTDDVAAAGLLNNREFSG